LDRREPFRLGQFHFPNEIVKVSDQGRHHVLESRVIAFGEPGNYGLSNRFLVELAHCLYPRLLDLPLA